MSILEYLTESLYEKEQLPLYLHETPSKMFSSIPNSTAGMLLTAVAATALRTFSDTASRSRPDADVIKLPPCSSPTYFRCRHGAHTLERNVRKFERPPFSRSLFGDTWGRIREPSKGEVSVDPGAWSRYSLNGEVGVGLRSLLDDDSGPVTYPVALSACG